MFTAMLNALGMAFAMGWEILWPLVLGFALGYTQITVPLCQQSTLAPGFYVATNGSDSNPGTLAAPFATLGNAQAAMRASAQATLLTHQHKKKSSLVPGFYVAPSGNDANNGSLGAPFATLAKAQAAMQASGAILTTYIRAGSYTPPSVANCNGEGVTCMLDLQAADNGETWSYYPPDGIDSADFTGGSTAFGNGLYYMISDHASNITINGLSLHNFQHSGVHSGGGAHSPTIINNVIFNGTITTQTANPGAIACYGCTNAIISHNVIHDIGSWGVAFANVNGDVSNMLVTGNVIYNTCTGRPDCSAIYLVDTSQAATNIQWTNNYIRDGNTGATLGSGFGSAMYADDCTSNLTATGNVITGQNGSNTAMLFHGGSNIHVNGNLIDLSTLQQSIMSFQTSSCPSNAMSGNQAESNIVIGTGPGGGYNLLSGAPPNNPLIANSDYFAYAGSAINSSGSYSDANPVSEDPQLSCWIYNIASGSPVFNAPVNFPGLAVGWGPPGFVIPQTGTPPSSLHTC